MSEFVYRIVAVIGPGRISLENGEPAIKPHNRLALWRPLRTQKEQECAITGQKIPRGSIVWRPTTHALYREDRISDAGMGHLCIQASLTHPGLGEVAKRSG